MRDWVILCAGVAAWVALTAALGRFVLTRFPETVAAAGSPRLTALLIVAIPVFLGILDVVLYCVGGNRATISYVMLSASAARPTVALATAYTFAVLLSHLYLPVTGDSPPGYDVVARMLFVLGPTFYALVIIAFGNGTLAAHDKAIEAGGQAWFALKLLGAVVVGGFAGRLLPQHPFVP